MSAGVALLNFGEPARPEREPVVEYLERIFAANAEIEDGADGDRARQLAERRAPALLEEYEAIGGSPLQAHAETQAQLLESELRDRGYDATTYLGMQYTEPFIPDVVEQARAEDIEHLVGLPVYPLCGPSTTVAALEELAAALEATEWTVAYDELTGWHRHPAYPRLRADAIRSVLRTQGLIDGASDDTAGKGAGVGRGLTEGTRLVFSAHGTPQHYLDAGSRYAQYVEEYCERVGATLGVEAYELGYQNHANRDVEWTQPDVETVVETLPESVDRIVVDPISFMHEQSETLSELDVELREAAEAAGLEFHRVPIPYDDDRFVSLLADLLEPFLAGYDPEHANLQPCFCREGPSTYCLNDGR